METDPECRGGGGPSTEAVDGEMRVRAEGCATVRDLLSDVTIDITRQRVNVSLSCDGRGAEVGPPSALPPPRARLETPIGLCVPPGHAKDTVMALSAAGRHSHSRYSHSHRSPLRFERPVADGIRCRLARVRLLSRAPGPGRARRARDNVEDPGG